MQPGFAERTGQRSGSHNRVDDPGLPLDGSAALRAGFALSGVVLLVGIGHLRAPEPRIGRYASRGRRPIVSEQRLHAPERDCARARASEGRPRGTIRDRKERPVGCRDASGTSAASRAPHNGRQGERRGNGRHSASGRAARQSLRRPEMNRSRAIAAALVSTLSAVGCNALLGVEAADEYVPSSTDFPNPYPETVVDAAAVDGRVLPCASDHRDPLSDG